MNTANLQLEGLCIAFAALNNLLIRKGVVVYKLTGGQQ